MLESALNFIAAPQALKAAARDPDAFWGLGIEDGRSSEADASDETELPAKAKAGKPSRSKILKAEDVQARRQAR